MDPAQINRHSRQIISAALAVHSELGTGVLEAVYEECLAYEIESRGLHVDTQLALPVVYRGRRIELGYRLDMLVENEIVVEVKAVARLLPVHKFQVLSYLRLGSHRLGLLINFHEPHLRDGIVRLVNRL